ncbi:MAG: TIGR04279 domain-containing protein [Methanosarcinaceae archaeon]|nr:TIGR04279 domain-containing protein [Methanosarcinaceae archaeon]
MKLNKTKKNAIAIFFMMLVVTLAFMAFMMPIVASNGSNSINITFVPNNWIGLSGGIPMNIPHPIDIEWEFTGNLPINAPMNINLNISNPSGNVRYPFEHHHIFHNGADVVVDFSEFLPKYKTKGDVVLINQSHGLMDIITAIRNINKNNLADIGGALLNRDTPQFEKLVSERLGVTTNITYVLGHNLNNPYTFYNLSTGDYAVIVLCNTTKPEFKILSTTTFQVLESHIIINAPHNNQEVIENTPWIEVDVTLNPHIPNVRYAAILIHEDAFRANIEIDSDGTRPNTSMHINNIHISKHTRNMFFDEFNVCLYEGSFTNIRSALANVTRNNIYNNKLNIINVMVDVIGKNRVSMHVPMNADEKKFNLYTWGLNRGNYILSIAAISENGLLVGFNQVNIEIVELPIGLLDNQEGVTPPPERPPTDPPIDPAADITIIQHILILPKQTTFQIGETVQFTATVYPEGADQRVAWTVENPEIGTIDENGLFIAKAIGTANIFATSIADPETHNISTINIESPVVPAANQPISSISISSKQTATQIGETIQFTADVYPEGSDQRVVWTVENPEMGTIDERGLFTAKKTGDVVVVATSVANPEMDCSTIATIEEPVSDLPWAWIVLIIIIITIIAAIALKKKEKV